MFVISKKAIGLIISLICITFHISVKAQVNTQTIKGNIYQGSTGLPLAGIHVFIDNYSSAISEDDGSFTIKIPGEYAVLTVEGKGYQTRLVTVKGRENITIKLFEDEFSSIYDKAYFSNSNAVLSQTINSVASVDSRDTWKFSGSNVSLFLKDKITGINATVRSGSPGIGVSMRLRGINSLNTSNQPLIILDGVIYDNNSYGNSIINGSINDPLSFIDPKDIENITIVKDGMSSYGSKSSNGIIYINTKHAEELTTRIDFVSYAGLNYKPSTIPVLNGYDYRNYIGDIAAGYNSQVQIEDVFPVLSDNPASSDYYRYHNNTNWQNEIFRNSYSQNYYMGITGGDRDAKYYLSVGYLDDKGSLMNTGNERYNFKFNGDIILSKKVTVSPSVMFSYISNSVMEDGFAPGTNPVFMSLIKSPFMSPYMRTAGENSSLLEGEDLFGTGNPVAILDGSDIKISKYRVFSSIDLNYLISPTITLNSVSGITFDKIREGVFIPHLGSVKDTTSTEILDNRLGQRSQRLFSVYTDNKLVYHKSFVEKNFITAQIGLRYNISNSSDNRGESFNSDESDYFHRLQYGNQLLRQTSGELGEWNWLSYYVTLNYNYKNKYFISLNSSLDGSSRFGKEAKGGIDMFSAKFGLFPSVGAAWLISSENFMNSLTAIELLKLRASFGITGNDNIGNYLAKQYYISQPFLDKYGIVRGDVANPGLSWETIQKLNVGLDLALFNERLSFTVDYFRNRTTNMLAYKPLNASVGFVYTLTNDGTMENNGFEIGINSRIIDRKFKWDLNLSFVSYVNRIVSLSKEKNITDLNGASILTATGRPLGLFYGYKTNGVYSTTEEANGSNLQLRMPNNQLKPVEAGDVRFVDTYNDNIIDEKDMQVIGDPNPDFTAMISSKVSWKQLTLEAVFTSSYGNDNYNYMRNQLESMSGYQNQTKAALNRWNHEGQITAVPKAVSGDPNGNARFSDRWIEDGSYLRLKTVSLSCNLPFTKSIFRNSSVFITGNNLITFTKYLGYDPEFNLGVNPLYQGIDMGLTPQVRSILIGLRIGL